MNVLYPSLFFFAAIAEVFLALYVLSANRKGTSNRLFSITSLLFAESSFCYAVFVSLPDENDLLLWYRCAHEVDRVRPHGEVPGQPARLSPPTV